MSHATYEKVMPHTSTSYTAICQTYRLISCISRTQVRIFESRLVLKCAGAVFGRWIMGMQRDDRLCCVKGQLQVLMRRYTLVLLVAQWMAVLF